MATANLKEQLKEHRDELIDHLDAAPERIKSYYLDQEPPDGFPEYEIAPHKQIIRRAASVIEFIFEYQAENPSIDLTTEWGTRDLEFTHIGVGLELLLQGIYMKTDPEGFIEELRTNSGETPHHSASKSQVMRLLPNSLTSNQKAQIGLVIDIAHQQRNNAVHFGLHGYHHHGLMIAYYEVAAYLIVQFCEDEFDIVDLIDDRRTIAREGPIISGQPPEDPLPLSTAD